MQYEHGIRLEHVYQVTAHAKDLSDSECGGAKHAVDKRQMMAKEGETSTVKEPYDAYTTIRDDYGNLTLDRFLKRGGVGIFRRFIYWVPASGTGSINRNFQHCQTLSSSLGGIKSLHHLSDVGIPGQLRVRTGSCHRCAGCQRGAFDLCDNIRFVGPAEVITLHPKEKASIRLGRHALSDLGVKLAGEAKEHELLAVELSYANEAFMLCEVVSTAGVYRIEKDFESNLGNFKSGDMVLDVRKLEPVSAGSSHYEYTEKVFPIFVEDIRKRRMAEHLCEADLSRRSTRIAGSSGEKKIYVLSAAGKSTILKLISAEDSVFDRRDLAPLAGSTN